MLLFLLPLLALANVSVVTSTTDLAWTAREIGGSFVEVSSLLDGSENPHYGEANPSFVARVASADVVCVVGLDLEVGWMPKVLSRSGNANVQPGGKGYCELGKRIRPLDVPSGAVDRSMGDLHPAGNPHFWLSPRALAGGAAEIGEALKRADPSHAAQFDANLKLLVARLGRILDENKKRLSQFFGSVKSTQVVEYHKEFAYFFEAYGLHSFGSIEEKPGIPPSAGRIAEIALGAKAAGVKVAIAAEFAPKKPLARFEELSGIRTVSVPTSIRMESATTNDYEKLQRRIIDALIETNVSNSDRSK